MWFKWEEAIFTLSSRPLKLVDEFTYLGSNISSTESGINICLVKVWTIFNRLSIIQKSDLSDKIKQDFFQTPVWIHHMNANKMHGKKATWKLHKNAMSYFEQILEATLHCTATYSPSKTLYKPNMICGALSEKQGCNIPLWTRSSSRPARTYIDSEWTLDVV